LDARIITCGLVALNCLSAAAQPVFRLGPDVTPPFVIAKAPPSYSAEARMARLEGSVLLSVVIGADGRPRDIRVAHPLGLGLDESAVENLRAWRFKPGGKAGSAVNVLVNEEVFFRPKRELWDWHLVRAIFRPPADAMRPVLTTAEFPPTAETEENASVTLAFDVSRDGLPEKLSVLKSSNTKWEDQVLKAMRGWRFHPGMKDGKVLQVPAWFEFVRGSHSPIPPAAIPPR
jgi:TonB family protein